jgi:hypothetical protein
MPVTIRLDRALSDFRSLSATALLAAGVLLAVSSTTRWSTTQQKRCKDYIATNMKAFDVPGLAIGIVAGDKLIYAEGFGVRSKGGAPRNP